MIAAHGHRVPTAIRLSLLWSVVHSVVQLAALDCEALRFYATTLGPASMMLMLVGAIAAQQPFAQRQLHELAG